MASGTGAASHLCCAVLCDVSLLCTGWIAFDREELRVAMVGRQMEYLQTKKQHIAGCGRGSAKRSMTATKKPDILTMNDVCGLCHCRTVPRGRECVVCASLQAVESRHSHY